MDIHFVVLLEQPVQDFAGFKHLGCLFISPVISHGPSEIFFYPLLLVPQLHLLFLVSPLTNFVVRLQAQDRSNLAIGYKFVDVNFKKGIGSNDDIVIDIILDDFVKNKSSEERSVCLLNHSVNNIDLVVNLPVGGFNLVLGV